MDNSVIGILGALLLIVIALAIGGFWVWTIIDCATKESDTGNTKLVWILVILFAGVFGSLIYVVARRPKRWAEVGR